MFQNVKRIKQIIPLEECFRMLEEELRGVLSINGEDGYPYGLPLNHYFVKEENRLYFHSGNFGYKIDCLKKDNKCSYNVIKKSGRNDDGWSLYFKSVIVFGKIHFLEDKKEIERISRELSHKFTSDEAYIDYEVNKSLDKTAMFYIEIEHITGKTINER